MYAESRRPSPWQGACLADAWFKPWRRRLGGGPRTKRALPGPAVASCRCAGRGSNSRLPAHTTRRRSQRDRGVNSHARIDRPRQCYDGGVRAHSQRTLPRLAVAQCAQEKSVRGERRRCCEHCRAAPRAKSKGSATFPRSRPPARRLSARRGLFAERLARRQARRDTSSSGRAFKLSHERLNPHLWGQSNQQAPVQLLGSSSHHPRAHQSPHGKAIKPPAGRARPRRPCRGGPGPRRGVQTGPESPTWGNFGSLLESVRHNLCVDRPRAAVETPETAHTDSGRYTWAAGCVGQWED